MFYPVVHTMMGAFATLTVLCYSLISAAIAGSRQALHAVISGPQDRLVELANTAYHGGRRGCVRPGPQPIGKSNSAEARNVKRSPASV
jgi:hypothetical protein